MNFINQNILIHELATIKTATASDIEVNVSITGGSWGPAAGIAIGPFGVRSSCKDIPCLIRIAVVTVS